ncbi:PepSY domain-containing protein [Pseudomonas aeruginosa]|nr:PepSY domain-containing protein [Pseudomonas aeruginosa]
MMADVPPGSSTASAGADLACPLADRSFVQQDRRRSSAATPTASTSTCIAGRPSALAAAGAGGAEQRRPEPPTVFKPLVSLFSPIEPSVYEARGGLPGSNWGRPAWTTTAPSSWPASKRRGWASPEPIGELYYSFEYNFFGAGFQRPRRPMGKSWLFFHGSDGRLLSQEVAGQGSWGERFYRLQYPIHGGRIAGLLGRIAIAALGLAIAGLSLTGVYIWWRKRRARRLERPPDGC